jgi:hypothetical protein
MPAHGKRRITFIRATPPMLVPLAASERQSGWFLGAGPGPTHINSPDRFEVGESSLKTRELAKNDCNENHSPSDPVSFPVEGVDGGSISMLAVRLG